MFIEIPAADGPAEAYAALPPADSTQPRPGVLLFMDALGVRPRLVEMADRIASWGYAVLAPNAFYRWASAAQVPPQGSMRDPEARGRFFEKVNPWIDALTAELALADTAAYLRWLTGRPGVSTPVAVVGYCFGARHATRAAGAFPGVVAACAGFHGGFLVTDAADSPHRSIVGARAEFLYAHADDDPSMPPEAVATLDRTLAAAGVTATNTVYAGARHGYTMSDSAAWDEAAAERHFEDVRALLARAL